MRDIAGGGGGEGQGGGERVARAFIRGWRSWLLQNRDYSQSLRWVVWACVGQVPYHWPNSDPNRTRG